MLGCQAEEARLIAGDAAPEAVAAPATTVAVARSVSAEQVASCVEYVGVTAMAGDGFALAIFEQAGGAVEGVQRWCEDAARTDPASLRRMGKQLTVIQQLTGASPATTSTVPVDTLPATTVSPSTIPATAPPTPTTQPPVVILGEGCDPNYIGACVPIAVDVDCAGRGGNGPVYVVGPVRVVGEDIYGLDGDRDRTGCE
jgi:hypothetical protein